MCSIHNFQTISSAFWLFCSTFFFSLSLELGFFFQVFFAVVVALFDGYVNCVAMVFIGILRLHCMREVTNSSE